LSCSWDLAPDSGFQTGSVRSTSAIARWASADYEYRGWRETDVTGQLGWRQYEFCTGVNFMLEDLMSRLQAQEYWSLKIAFCPY
jgi:hypothetical protein